MAEPAARFLQVCPNDHPPFADICRYYEAAARELGWHPLTVVLERRTGAPEPGFRYLDAAGGAAATGQGLGAVAARPNHPPVLVLCHRYRAHRAVLTSGLRPGRMVTVAHEFGLLGRRRRRWRRRADRLLGRPAVVFAGVSPAVADELTAATGTPAALLPNGLDLAQQDAARLSRAPARRLLGLSGDGFVVGVVGRLHPKKCPELALAGFRAALPAMPGARLVFVGDGELAQGLHQAAAGLPVTFAGPVAGAARAMPALDLLLLPSGEREAFGMVALEAMAAAVPVLCGPAAGPRYVVGNAGLAFDAATADGVAAALVAAWRARGTADRQALVARARARVESTFSVAAAARRLEQLAAGALPAAEAPSGTDSAHPGGGS